MQPLLLGRGRQSLKRIHIGLVIISILMCAWVLAIKYYAGIFNIGSKTFLGVGVLLFLFSLLHKSLKKRIDRLSLGKQKFFRSVSVILKAFVAAVLVLVLVESNCMLAALFNEPDDKAVLVVLGSEVTTSGPSLMTCKRLDAAYDYLTEHPDAVCILSGGQGEHEPWSEAKGMADYLILKGIESRRLYLEDQSSSTRENLNFSKQLMEENNLGNSVTIVTNAFHIYRAGRIAKRENIDFSVLPAKSIYPLFPSYYVRELYAILADWFIYS